METFLDKYMAQKEHFRQMRESEDPAFLLESMNQSLKLIAKALGNVSESEEELSALVNVDDNTEKMAGDTEQMVSLFKVFSRLALKDSENGETSNDHLDKINKTLQRQLGSLGSQYKNQQHRGATGNASEQNFATLNYMKSKDKFNNTYAKTNYAKMQYEETVNMHTLNSKILKTLLRMEKRMGMLNNGAGSGGLLDSLFGGGNGVDGRSGGKGNRTIRKLNASFKRSGVGKFMRRRGFFSNGAKLAGESPSMLGSTKNFFSSLADKGKTAWQSRPSFLGNAVNPTQARAGWFEKFKPQWADNLAAKSGSYLGRSADAAKTMWSASKSMGGKALGAFGEFAGNSMNALRGAGSTAMNKVSSLGKAMPGMLSGGKALFSKVAMPLTAALSSYGGVMDEANGKRIDSVGGIIPEGLKNLSLDRPLDSALSVLSAPTDIAMNAGRYAGNKFNQGYEALSGQSMGADIYDLVNDKMPNMMKTFTGTISGLPTTISTAFSKSDFGKDFKSFMTESGQYYTQFTNYAQQSLNALGDWASKKMGDVKNAANNVAKSGSNAVAAAQSAYTQKRAAGGSLVEAAQSAATAAASGFSASMQDGKRAFSYKMDNGVTQQKIGGDLNWRSNNSGNLQTSFNGDGRNDGNAKQFKSKEAAMAHYQKKYKGVIDIDQKTGSLIFDTEQNGDVGRKNLLQGKAYGDKTVDQMVQKYAVSDYSGKADHGAYASSIYKAAGTAGIDIKGKKMSEMSDKEMSVIMDAMRKHEGGKKGTTVYRDANGKIVDQDAAMKLAGAAVPKTADSKPTNTEKVPPVAVTKQADLVNAGKVPTVANKPTEVKPVDKALTQQLDNARYTAQYGQRQQAPAPSGYNQMAQASSNVSPTGGNKGNNVTLEDIPLWINGNGLMLTQAGM